MRAAFVLTLLALSLGCSGLFDPDPMPIWEEPSPSGAYLGAVAEVDGPYGPVWAVSIEEVATGFEWSARMPTPSTLSVYPAWDAEERLWVYDSDVGAIYRYDRPEDPSTWSWSRRTDPDCDGTTPPRSALPAYARDRGWCREGAEPYAPDPSPPVPIEGSGYAGTTWYLTDLHPEEPIDHALTFLEGGRIATQHPNDTTPRNDRWWPTERGLTFSYNDDYATYELTRTGPDTLEGPAHNVAGSRWRVRLDRR